jgi:hypothetical protein
MRERMRDARTPSTDFVDAGYLLMNAWTKQRTMRGLIGNNGVVFNQAIEPTVEVLCNEQAVQFLQLRYLLRPADVAACPPWSRVEDVRVDDSLEVDAAPQGDDRVRGLPVGRLDATLARTPALDADSALWRLLAPLPGTSLTIEPPAAVTLRLDDLDAVKDQAFVLPIAYDAAWRASSGEVRAVGGLLGLVGAAEREVRWTFVPDVVGILRALSMTLAQALAIVGIIGLAYASPVSFLRDR